MQYRAKRQKICPRAVLARVVLLYLEMVGQMFHVERIDYSKIDELLGILKERAIWLNQNGKGMWDLDKLTKDQIIKRYDEPEIYVSYDDKEKIGGFILIHYDKNYWKDRIGEKALYIHKFVVRLGYGKKGYSDKMIEWIKIHAMELKKDYIRLDFMKDREYLKIMYKKNGFEDIEELKLANGDLMIKAEYKIV